MEEVSNLSLFAVTHVAHDPKWMTKSSSSHSLICLACASEMLQDSSVPNVKKKFILSEIHVCLKESEENFAEFFVCHEEFAWHFADVVFDEVQNNNDLTLQVSSQVLSQLCCCLESDELVYGILQKIFTKIDSGCEAHQCLSIIFLLHQLLDSIPALANTLVENGVLIKFLVNELSSEDESVAYRVIGLLSKLLSSSSLALEQMATTEEVCQQIFPVINSTQSLKVLENAVGLIKTMVESGELAGVVVKVALTISQHTLPSVIKKILHTRREHLQIDAVQIIGQLLTRCDRVEELGEKLLHADLAEFLFEHLSTTNQTLLSSIFCSLLLMTEADKFFRKCHSVLGIDPLLRAAEQCLCLNFTDALHYGLQLLSVILAKHPKDQKLLSGGDIYQHLQSFLAKCVLHGDSKIFLPGLKCMQHIFRKDYIPIPVEFTNLISSVQAAINVIGQFPRPLVRGIKRNLIRRDEVNVQQGTHSKLVKQEQAIWLSTQITENAFRLAAAISEDEDMYEESQFTAPSKHSLDNSDRNHANGLASFTHFLLGILDNDIIPTVMINYEVFQESAVPLFSSFLRTLCQAIEVDVTLDFHKKLVSSSFIQWSMEIKAKFYPDSSVTASVDDFVSSLCSKLVMCTYTLHSSSSLYASLKAALKPCRDISALCKVLTEDGGSTVSDLGRCPTGAGSLERQEGCLAILYCARFHDDRLVSNDSLLEMLVHFMKHQADQELSEITLKHILFLFACVDDARESEGVGTLLHLMNRTQRQVIYSHHPQMIKWCFSSSFIPAQFSQEMLELWMERMEIHEEDSNQNDEVKFFVSFISLNKACFLALLNLFITPVSKKITEKILTLLQLLFSEKKEMEIANSSEMISCLQNHLPEMQRRILIQQEKDVKIGWCWFVNLLELLSSVYTQCSSDTLEFGSSDLKLVFHVIKALSGSDKGNPPASQEETLLMLNYLTSVLLLASASGDSRVASMMLSSESLLRHLHQLATEKPSSSLEVIFTAKSKLKHQSVFLTGYLAATSARFKINPEVSLQWDVDILFGCLTKIDVCAKGDPNLTKLLCQTTGLVTCPQTFKAIYCLQLLTSMFEMNFESQVVQIQDKPPQRMRSSDDVGLALSARTVRSLFFLLQNILLQGSDFIAWNSLLCLSSLWKYVSEKNKKVSDHLLHQPWNGFLQQCCLGFYGDTLPPAWFIRFLTLFPSQVPRKSLEAMANSILQQNPETLDHRMLVSAVIFVREMSIIEQSPVASFAIPFVKLILGNWDTIKTNQTLAEKCQDWMKRAKLCVQELSKTSPVEMLYIDGVVLSVDLSFLHQKEDLSCMVCSLGM